MRIEFLPKNGGLPLIGSKTRVNSDPLIYKTDALTPRPRRSSNNNIEGFRIEISSLTALFVHLLT